MMLERFQFSLESRDGGSVSHICILCIYIYMYIYTILTPTCYIVYALSIYIYIYIYMFIYIHTVTQHTYAYDDGVGRHADLRAGRDGRGVVASRVSVGAGTSMEASIGELSPSRAQPSADVAEGYAPLGHLLGSVGHSGGDKFLQELVCSPLRGAVRGFMQG